MNSEEEISEEEAEKILAAGGEPDVVDEVEEDASGERPMPEWATLPANLKKPKKGTRIAFMRIPASWTPDPAKGDRWCACWPITELEERLAYARSRGDQMRSVAELAKQSIRVVDGYRADWTAQNKPGDVPLFWAQIGPKGRQVIRNYYVRTHMVTDDEIVDFFAKHFVDMTVT